MKQRTAILLLSGGLDSATAGAWAKKRGLRLVALTVLYGQRHAAEILAARRVARHLGVRKHVEISVELDRIGGSALTDRAIRVPKARSWNSIAHGIPVTYVPARNTVFLALALGLAEVQSAADIVIGVNALDYSGYPDCRPAFVRAFERLARVATKAGIEGRSRFRIHTPLIRLNKARIVRLGARLGVDFGLTHSCYDPVARTVKGRMRWRACGRCDSCLLRRKGFLEAGMPDPIAYA
ncbi:MAG: 7-cyano-7-deazaguanine synthase QueC [Planctomycetes bacterium]|nr:7-cyano-7-deazaguanine synthase QueC [Planctomycetota bacterium]